MGNVVERPEYFLRGFPPGRPADPNALIGNVLISGDNAFPCAVLRQSALAHNAAWMQNFVRHYGIELAPHGKTSMAPKILSRQVQDGASFLTFATMQQARAGLLAGARQLLIANQIVNHHDLDYLARMTSDGQINVICFVDSVAGVSLLDEALFHHPRRDKLQVLLEIGVNGGRAGVRNTSQAVEVAQAVARSRHLRLAGLAGYEGVYSPKDADAVGKVDRYLMGILAIARSLLAMELLDTDEIILSAGGSKFFDRVAEIFSQACLLRPVRTLIRPGCYLYHDEGIYEQAMSAMYTRSAVAQSLGRLRPAMELWSQVQSRPEPNRVICSMGRRESSYDAGMPIARLTVSKQSAGRALVLPDARTIALNDQHAFVEIPPHAPLAVGDLVGFGISHPCTVFDKWRGLFLVDDDYVVLDYIETYFG